MSDPKALVPVTEGASAPARERLTWQRGRQAEFRIKCLNRDGTPMVPLDAAKYPAWGIYSPSGVLVDSGVMQQYQTPGSYRVLWNVPITAELSNDRASWLFQTTFLNSKRKQFQNTMDFNVTEKQNTSSGNTDVVELGIEGMPYRAIWRGDFEPSELSVQVFNAAHPTTINIAPVWTPVGKAGLTRVDDGDSVLYYLDIPGTKFLSHGSYTVLWVYRETASAAQQLQYTQYRVIRRGILQYLPSLRFAVERLPLDPNAPQKITDADLMEALTYGMHDLNSYHPVSSYTIDKVPQQLQSLWMMCSMRWMFQSQHITLGSQAFSFQGASTSLDFDQTGIMDAAIGRLDGWINDRMGPAKISVNRLLTSNASVGIRGFRPMGYNQRVIRYDASNGSGNDSLVLATLTTLGLLP